MEKNNFNELNNDFSDPDKLKNSDVLSNGNISDNSSIIDKKSDDFLSDRNFSNDTQVVEKNSDETFSDRNSSDDAQVVEKISDGNDFYLNNENNKLSDKINETNNKSSVSNINTSDKSSENNPETHYYVSGPVKNKDGIVYNTEYYSSNSDKNVNGINSGNNSSNTDKHNFVKKKTKFPKVAVAAIICIALVGGLIAGTLLGGPIRDKIYSSRPTPDIIDNNENQDNNSDNSGFLTYAKEDKDTSALSTAEIASKCLPSVVEIRTETVTTGSFFQDYVTEGAGSGVIITEDGYIVTNYHVIAEANSIFVTLNSGEEYEADLIGADEKTDLAVVKIEETDLIPATIGDSDLLVVGEKAVAIGNPLGELGGTVTDGIISALDREMTIEGQKMTLLQTNAAINPGNSGGGLFNGAGNLIAIVDAKSSGTGIEGLGFAIPSNTMSEIVNQIINYGYVKGYVDTGMSYIEINDYYTAMQYRVNEFGVYILKVYGDEALDAGFQSGDLILKIDDKSITFASEIDSILENKKVGDYVEFKVLRNRSTLTLSLKLDEYVPESNS